MGRRTRVTAILILTIAAVCIGGYQPLAVQSQVTAGGNGVMRFDDLRELNNKLARAIAQFDSHSVTADSQRSSRILNDLEATKLRAVDQFPPLFGLPYGETFRQLSCIDNDIAASKTLIRLAEGPSAVRLLGGWVTGRGRLEVTFLVRALVKGAKSCKDRLEVELASGTGVPSGALDDLRELNNKLGRAIAQFDSHSVTADPPSSNRILNDLEATKLRAVDQFPEILDPPYGETFSQLSCIDNDIASSKTLIRLAEGPSAVRLLGGWVTGRGRLEVTFLVRALVKRAKVCKDTLEVELMHSFDLKPSERNNTGVSPTTPNGTDTQNPNKLNAPKTIEHAYKRDGFVGRHEQDYIATAVNGSNPDSWPRGRNVLFFDVFDLFGSTRGAQKSEQASEANLRSNGFSPVADQSLGPGEAVFQKQTAGSPLLSTVIDVQRGTFIMKIAGSCNGCSPGSIESSLENLAQAQLAQAVSNGFLAGTTTSQREDWQVSGASRSHQDPFNLCVYLKGPAGQTGTVSTQAGSPDFQSQVPPQQKPFTLSASGLAEVVFTEPPADNDGPNQIAFTIARNEPDGSVSKSGSQWGDTYQPPPWGLPSCTPP